MSINLGYLDEFHNHLVVFEVLTLIFRRNIVPSIVQPHLLNFYEMKKIFYLVALGLIFIQPSLAQFPGGGGPGGGSRGGGGDRGGRDGGGMFGMGQQQQQQQEPSKGIGRIFGTVVDSISNKPVEYATVGLFDIKTRMPIDGTTTDQKGNFILKGLPDGDFRIEISFVGYKTFKKADVKLGKGSREIKFGNMLLGPDVRQLGEVTVVSQRDLIEDKVDRLVYNAEKDIGNKTGDASDVLKKVPLLSVDLEGNVSMRGSSNIKVLINGKPSSILAGSVADALKQIPSDMIKSVEVITSPSARYDGEGTAGIVNIITKKNNLQGLTGTVNFSPGTRGTNLFSNVNFRYRKIGVSLGVNGHSGYNPTGGSILTSRQLPTGTTSKTNQANDGFGFRLFGGVNLAFDYDITSNDNVRLSFRNGVRAMNSTNNQLTTSGLGTDALQALFGNNITSNNVAGNFDVNFDYTRKYAKEGKELAFLAQVNRNNNNNDYLREQFRGSDENAIFYKEKNVNRPYSQEMTFQLDYEDPISATQKIEIGAKAIIRDIANDFQFYADSLRDNRGFVINPKRSNVFNYIQNVFSGYTAYTINLPNKWALKPGIRYEYTQVKASFQNTDPINLPDFGAVIPSLSVSKSFKGGTIRASYNRRLQRPGVQNLNPNVSQSDPFNLSFGNPYLTPEFTNNVELNFNTFYKTSMLNVSTYARFTDNTIETVRFRGDLARFEQMVKAQGINVSGVSVNNNTLITTSQNTGDARAYGVNIFGSLRPTSKIQISLNVNSTYVILNSPALGIKNQGWMFDGGGNLQAQLGKRWSLQVSSFGRGSRVQLQGTDAGFRFYNLAFQRDFKNKRGSWGLGVDNPFQNYIKQVSSLSSDVPGNVFSQTNTMLMYNRGFRLRLNYQFGKMTFDGNFFKRKKSINNDDQKSGGDDSGGQSAPAAPGGMGGRRGG
jgi:ferric enterobactin receptor